MKTISSQWNSLNCLLTLICLASCRVYPMKVHSTLVGSTKSWSMLGRKLLSDAWPWHLFDVILIPLIKTLFIIWTMRLAYIYVHLSLPTLMSSHIIEFATNATYWEKNVISRHTLVYRISRLFIHPLRNWFRGITTIKHIPHLQIWNMKCPKVCLMTNPVLGP